MVEKIVASYNLEQQCFSFYLFICKRMTYLLSHVVSLNCYLVILPMYKPIRIGGTPVKYDPIMLYSVTYKRIILMIMILPLSSWR